MDEVMHWEGLGKAQRDLVGGREVEGVSERRWKGKDNGCLSYVDPNLKMAPPLRDSQVFPLSFVLYSPFCKPL